MSYRRYNLIRHLTIVRIIMSFGRFLIWLGKVVSGILGRLIFIILIIPKGIIKIIIKLGYVFFGLLSLILLPIRMIREATERAKQRRNIAQQALHNAKEFRQSLIQIGSGIKKEVVEEIDEIKTGAREVRGEVQEKLSPRRSRKSLIKSALGFAVLILIILGPIKLYQDYTFFQGLKIKLAETTNAAMSNLFSAKSAIEGQDFTKASNDFSKASANFLNAEKDLSAINNSILALASLFPNEKAKLVGNSKYFARAGQLTSELGLNLSMAMDSLFKRAPEATIIDVLDSFLDYGAKAENNAEELNNTIAKIDIDSIPEEYQIEFTNLSSNGIFLESSLEELLDIAERLKIFLGGQYDKRYLLIFQNNTEARATGGFMGSFALVDFSNGKIKNMEVPKGGTYDTEGGLRVLITAPKPLWLVNPLWHLWDSNWWPDWPTSAEKIMWFYEKSDGPTVDGVISFTPDVIIDLLEILGPIDMTEDYGLIITAENFLDETQAIVEEKPKENEDENNEPKAIIGDLIDRIITELTNNLDRERLIKLVGLLENNLDEKHILLYFTDSLLEEKVTELGWAGQIKEASQDYLMVVNTNIAGAKSDKEIEQRIFYNPEILPDGTVLGKLRIERDHRAKRGADFTGFRNVNWLRVYVPAGSQLIKASGFKLPDESYFEAPEEEWAQDQDLIAEESLAIIDEESGVHIYEESQKTVFANWSMVDPGEMAVLEFTYKLPFKVIPKSSEAFWDEFEKENLYTYTFLAQKQPGASNSSIQFTVKHIGYDLVWQYPEGYPDYEFSTDRTWASLLKTAE
ncbi:MAG: DUF4012 domain-containing protein [bacterium]